MSNDETFLEALGNFYKLKSEYDTQISRQKNKIKNNNTLTKKQKISRLKKLKFKCIKCKKEGGTIFTTNDRVVKVTCGHQARPCDLNIELDKVINYHL